MINRIFFKPLCFLLLVLCSSLFMHQAQAQTQKQLKKTIDSLSLVNQHFKLYSQVILENKQLLKLHDNQRDSLQMLLNNSRYREERYRTEAGRLKRLLVEAQYTVDSLQKAYDEISVGISSTLTEYRKQIEQLTIERNGLAGQSQTLQAELSKLKNASQNALFALTIRAVPGELKRNSSGVSLGIDQVLLMFQLTRAPKVNEYIIVKLFDAANKEIPLKASYRNSLGKPTSISQKFVIKPDAPRKLSKGNYFVRLFMTNVEQGINNQSIGIAEFSVN